MHKIFKKATAGVLSLLMAAQVMIFGDGTAQGILHADTLAEAAEHVETYKNARQLKDEYDSAVEGLGEVEYFSVDNETESSYDDFVSVISDENADEMTPFSLFSARSSERSTVFNVQGRVQKEIFQERYDDIPVYVIIFDAGWNELARQQVADDGSYSVTAEGYSVYNVKYECDGYLPFFIRNYGTGSYLIGTGESEDTITLIPGDTTYNAENGNQWSDEWINSADHEYVLECSYDERFGRDDRYRSYRGDSDYNPTMDMDAGGTVSDTELQEFCEFYTSGNSYDISDLTAMMDINRDGVINDNDYKTASDIVNNILDPSGYTLPDLSGNDGCFTEEDLSELSACIGTARNPDSEVYIYNHDINGDLRVDTDDYTNGYDQILQQSQKRTRSSNYKEYMDKDNNGYIDDTDVNWFRDAYDYYGEIDSGFARKYNITLCGDCYFSDAYNLQDTNLDLNGYTLYAEEMSFCTEHSEFWNDKNDAGTYGATLDLNGGLLVLAKNFIFRTNSLVGWNDKTPGQLLNFNGGILCVDQDFNFGKEECEDIMLMTHSFDELYVSGRWTYITLADMTGKWTDGIIHFYGPEWIVNEESGDKAIYSSGTHVIEFAYPGGQQVIRWANEEEYTDEEGNSSTGRRFNFDYIDSNGECQGVRFIYGYSPERYYFRPWFRSYGDFDYTLYRKGWEIGDGVHIATGNYTKSFTDLSVETPGVHSDFVRTYNSTSKEEGSFGVGWDFNIDVSKIIIPAAGYYQVVLPDGSNTTFKDDGNGGFECLNAHSSMTKSGNEYTVVNAAQSQYHFNNDGELDWIKDANGNKLEISPLQNNKRTVTSSTKRKYTIEYNGNSEHLRVVSISDDETGRTVEYKYNSDFQLVSVVSVSKAEEYYSYEDGRLTEIKNYNHEITDRIKYNNNGSVDWLVNASGLKQEYTYNKSDRQTGLKEYDGDVLVKEYVYDYDEKYAVKNNTVHTDGKTYEVDKITYTLTDGKNKFDEISKNTDIVGNETSYERDSNGNITRTTYADGTYTLARYNSKNMPVAEVDEVKNVTIYKYDGTGINVTQKYQSLSPVSDADSIVRSGFDLSTLDYSNYAVTAYTYYGASSETAGITGLIHTVTDPEGYVTEYVYGPDNDADKNNDGLPVTVTLKDGSRIINTVSYEYNSQLQVSKETTSFDISGNLYSVKEYEYDSFNNVTSVRDYGTGNTALVTITDYDPLGRKTGEYTPKYSDRTHGTTYTYYPDGNIKTQTDAEGNVTSFVYSAYGLVTKRINPDGTQSITEYDGLQREKYTCFKSKENGFKQTLTRTDYDFINTEYDIYESPGSRRGCSVRGLKTTKTSYITSEKQVVTETISDIRNNILEEIIVKDPQNNVTKRKNRYYANGNLATQEDALNNITEYEYNTLNKLTKKRSPFTGTSYSVTENSYDRNGNLTETRQTVQEQGEASVKYSVTQNKYNAQGLLVQVTLSDGTDDGEKNITRYTYNNAGLQTSSKTGLNSEDDNDYLTTNYVYDSYGRLVRTTDSANYNSGTITYDLNGNILTNKDANGSETTYSYDALNRVLNENTVNTSDSSKNISKSYVYDSMGRVTSSVCNDISTSYAYDSLGRIYQELSSEGFKGYFYEGVSKYTNRQLTGIAHYIIYSDVEYTYDDEMRISQVYEGDSLTASYTYDANGNKASETLANGVTSCYTYNDANRIISLTISGGSDITPVQYSYSYYLDGSDSEKIRNENGIQETTTYEYDGLKRLTKETVESSVTDTYSETAVSSATDIYSYSYDDYSNRIKMTVSGSENYTVDYNYNDSEGYKALLQTETKTYESEDNQNTGTVPETTVYTYDKNGNQLSKTTSSKTENFSYDGLNQLIGYTDGTTSASYAYNIEGLRVRKTVNGQSVKHIWDSNKQIAVEYNPDEDVYTADVYVRGTNLLANFSYSHGAKSDYHYYSQNAHGDVVNISDSSSAIIKSYSYDAFGVEKNIDESDTNCFRYCGEYYDKETGTVYLRARYYDPGIGRFISRDSFTGKNEDPLSLNLYTYCENNPIKYSDPSGFDAIDAASFAVNNPRPTHKVNSAGDAKFYTDWDNKFKQILNAPARVNSQSDATYRSKVVTAIEAKGESEYYKEWLQLPLDKLNISWIVPSSVVSNNESMIKKLKPKMQPLVRAFLINANESNHGLFISWGLRTNDDEKKFSDGVINGKHTKGLAVDVEFWDDVYKDVWPGDPMEFHWKICDYGIYDPNDPRWYEIGPIGQSSGLLWGNSFQDNPHFYLPE